MNGTVRVILKLAIALFGGAVIYIIPDKFEKWPTWAIITMLIAITVLIVVL
jgi:hypothetical protein